MNTTLRQLVGAAIAIAAGTSFAGSILSVEREATIDGAPATVWKLLGNFNTLDVWLPPVAASTQRAAAPTSARPDGFRSTMAARSTRSWSPTT